MFVFLLFILSHHEKRDFVVKIFILLLLRLKLSLPQVLSRHTRQGRGRKEGLTASRQSGCENEQTWKEKRRHRFFMYTSIMCWTQTLPLNLLNQAVLSSSFSFHALSPKKWCRVEYKRELPAENFFERDLPSSSISSQEEQEEERKMMWWSHTHKACKGHACKGRYADRKL